MGNQPGTKMLQQNPPEAHEYSSTEQALSQKPAVLLVIQQDAYDWSAIFAGSHLADGRTIQVVQCGWPDMLVSSDSPHTPKPYRTTVDLQRPIRTVKPDFVLVRNEVRAHSPYNLCW